MLSARGESGTHRVLDVRLPGAPCSRSRGCGCRRRDDRRRRPGLAFDIIATLVPRCFRQEPKSSANELDTQLQSPGPCWVRDSRLPAVGRVRQPCQAVPGSLWDFPGQSCERAGRAYGVTVSTVRPCVAEPSPYSTIPR